MAKIKNLNRITYFLLWIFSVLNLLIFLLPFNNELKLFIFTWLGNVFILYSVYYLKVKKNTHFNVYTLFFISYYLFSSGQLILYSFGIEYNNFNLLEIFSLNEVLKYSLYFNLSSVVILIASIVVITKEKLIHENRVKLIIDSINQKVFYNATKKVSISMFIISTPFYLIDLFTKALQSSQYGYRSLYIADASEGITEIIISSINYLFFPSIFLLLLLYKKNKIVSYFLLSILLLVAGLTFFIGVRSVAMGALMALVFFWNAEIKTFSFAKKIIVFTSTFIIIYFLPIIQSFRGETQKSLEVLISTANMSEKNFLVSILGELGSTMQVWLLVEEIIPTYEFYKIGESYIASILAIFPSILYFGNSFSEKAHLSGWLMEYNNMNYGPGFSLLGETFYNFGWVGIPFVFIIAYIIFTLISNNFWKGELYLLKNAFSAAALYIFATAGRSSIYLSIREELYSIIIPALVIYIIFKTDLRKKNN